MPLPETESRGPVCQYTDDGWSDEDAAKGELDRRLALCADLFAVHAETSGQYLQPRYRAEEKQPRIDRLLIPKARLIEAGWQYGVIGIECKKSGTKLGPAVAQCMDYGRAVFKSRQSHISVTCEWVFLWPLSDFAGDIASLMTQNRIGGVSGGRWCLLNFKSACGSLLSVTNEGVPQVGTVKAGCRTGSR